MCKVCLSRCISELVWFYHERFRLEMSIKNLYFQFYSQKAVISLFCKFPIQMLNCIMGMVEKTKRALAILQHRSFEYASINSLPIWAPPGTPLRNRLNVPPPPLDPSSHTGLDVHELRISREPLLTTIHFAKSPNHPSEVDRAMASAQAAADSARRTRLTGNNHFGTLKIRFYSSMISKRRFVDD